jgi:Ca2+-binding EF-hand superfamily protein
MSKQTLTLFGLSLVIVLGFGITYKNLAPVTDDGYRSARERAMLKRYDANGDGELDAQEREQFKKEVEAEQKVWLERYDLDGDGEISSEEKKAAKVKLESAKKKDPGSKVPQKVPPKPLLAR